MPSVPPYSASQDAKNNSNAAYDWYEAIHEYLLHQQAHRAPKTVQFYKVQLRQLAAWAENNTVPLQKFGKRHMDRYLTERSQTVSRSTLHHDGVAAKAFLKWCSRNDVLERNALIDYEVKAAPRPPKYMPTAEEVGKLLQASRDFWSLPKNPDVKYHSMDRRVLHRDRNYAVLLLLVDTACRIGEALALKVGDYRSGEREVRIRESKGREPRALPLSPETAEAIEQWLRARARLMRDAVEDEGWLFPSETGGPVEPGRFGKAMGGYRDFAKLPRQITPHALRHFALNRLAKHNLLAAQQIAGHKNPQTTLIYTRIDADFVRKEHEAGSPLRGVLAPRADRRKRLL